MKRLDFMNVVYVVLKRCMDVVTDDVTDDVDDVIQNDVTIAYDRHKIHDRPRHPTHMGDIR